jgi:predicted phosphodiesterase|tara:strand:+ start:36 stop:857 length:822 start_codon:yes stop_codon:yes gene_type:complete
MKKKDKEFVEKNEGLDKIRGRPIRLNRHKLELNNKEYIELVFIGDAHIGYPTSNIEKIQAMLDYIVETKTYVILMGDMIEAGLKDSIGDSVYRQKLNPQEQMEKVLEILEPSAQKGLILGMHEGNHEMRITKNTGIDITKVMARMLNVRYLGYSCWSLFTVGRIRYSLYTTHGCTGSVQEHTKLNAVVKLGKIVSSDVVAYGHSHGLASDVITRQYFDGTKNKIVEDKQYVVLTGSYLEWDGSYAQMKNYPISKIGSPKIKLFADRKDIHFSI